MCSYPHNSPEAAARIVALVLISDGQAQRTKHTGAGRATVAKGARTALKPAL